MSQLWRIRWVRTNLVSRPLVYLDLTWDVNWSNFNLSSLLYYSGNLFKTAKVHFQVAFNPSLEVLLHTIKTISWHWISIKCVFHCLISYREVLGRAWTFADKTKDWKDPRWRAQSGIGAVARIIAETVGEPQKFCIEDWQKLNRLQRKSSPNILMFLVGQKAKWTGLKRCFAQLTGASNLKIFT